MGLSESLPSWEGQILAGKYRVDRLIGRGGMGDVVAAEHLQLGQMVAIKILRPESCRDSSAVARFVREARATASLRSDHVARVIDVGTLDSGLPYIVMEHLLGTNLDEVLQKGGPLPIETAVALVLQACEAIAEAHSLRIIHRDLKPSNLFLTHGSDGRYLVKVLDFGISKAILQDSSDSITTTTQVLGTPAYMSPEQIRHSKYLDGRTDVWSLGAILYELLTGVPAYEAEASSAVLAKIIADPPAPVRTTRPDAPAALEKVILRCLKKDPDDRYGGVAELSKALLPFADDDGPLLVERIERIATAAVPTDPDNGFGIDVLARVGIWRSTMKYIAVTVLAFSATIAGTKLLTRKGAASPAPPSGNAAQTPSDIVPPGREVTVPEAKPVASLPPALLESPPTTSPRKTPQPIGHGGSRSDLRKSHATSAPPPVESGVPEGLADRK